MAADVAMTKKGFGEMAITGCIAGPIFNILIGLGLSMSLSILKSEDPLSSTVSFSLYDKGELDMVAVLPLTLLSAQFVVLILLLLNALNHKFKISFKRSLISTLVYSCVIIGLVTYSIIKHI